MTKHWRKVVEQRRPAERPNASPPASDPHHGDLFTPVFLLLGSFPRSSFYFVTVHKRVRACQLFLLTSNTLLGLVGNSFSSAVVLTATRSNYVITLDRWSRVLLISDGPAAGR